MDRSAGWAHRAARLRSIPPDRRKPRRGRKAERRCGSMFDAGTACRNRLRAAGTAADRRAVSAATENLASSPGAAIWIGPSGPRTSLPEPGRLSSRADGVRESCGRRHHVLTLRKPGAATEAAPLCPARNRTDGPVQPAHDPAGLRGLQREDLSPLQIDPRRNHAACLGATHCPPRTGAYDLSRCRSKNENQTR